MLLYLRLSILIMSAALLSQTACFRILAMNKLAVWPWASYLNSLRLSFPFYKIRITMAPISYELILKKESDPGM